MKYLKRSGGRREVVMVERDDKPRESHEDDVIMIDEIKTGLSVIQVSVLESLYITKATYPGLLFALKGYGWDELYDKAGWLQTIKVVLDCLGTRVALKETKEKH